MKRISLACLLALLLTLTACGGGNGVSSSADMAAPSAPMAAEGGGFYSGTAQNSPSDSAMDMAEMETPQEESVPDSARQPDKIIHTAALELETTDFDRAAASLTQLAEDLGGYLESSSIGDRGSGYRWADYTVRVPAERYEEFLHQAGELCHETWRSTDRRNISEDYYDAAGRLKTQQIKLERLQTLLEKADNMADIITIESAIAETEWMIEDLSGTLRHYDAQVDYATVNISLQEVYRLSNVEEPAASFSGRLGAAFSQGLQAFGRGLENLAVALAYGWVWVLLAALVILAAVAVLKKRLRRRGAPEKRDENKPGEP